MAREVLYQGLLEIPVLYQDNSKDSIGYFRINQLPNEFTAGKNLFSFKCNPITFLDNSELYVEVLDSAGLPIYTEVNIDAESDEQFAVVSVFVDSTTAPGPGTVILCGTIDQDTNGNAVNTNNGVNIRWNNPIQIYPSKRNNSAIVFDLLPNVSISSSLQPYINYFYPGNGNRFTSSLHSELTYLLYNNTPVLLTGSLSLPFNSDMVNGAVYISSSDISNLIPDTTNITTVLSESISLVLNSGSIVLANPLIIKQSNSNTINEFKSATVNAKITYEQTPYSSSLANTKYNLITATFSNLDPISGTVSRIKSYYKQISVGEYILFNESDITSFESEYGYTTSSLTLQLPLHGITETGITDFKFEFINPDGTPSNQVVYAKNYNVISPIQPLAYGSFYSDEDQSILAVNTPQPVRLNQQFTNLKINLSGSGGIQFDHAGIYKFTYVAQVTNNSNSIQDAIFWIKYNDVDFPHSTTLLNLPAQKSTGNPSSQIMTFMLIGQAQNDNDKIELWWQSTSTDVSLNYEVASTYPEKPSVIANISPVR
jgi:hypothetical protein